MESNKSIVKDLLLNTNVNFLFGAGTSFNKLEGKVHFPLMWDLTLFLKAEPSVKEFYNKLNGNALLTVIKNIYDEHLYGETANVESFLTALEGIVPYMVDSSLKTALNDQVTAIKSLIAKRIKQSDIDSCLEN